MGNVCCQQDIPKVDIKSKNKCRCPIFSSCCEKVEDKCSCCVVVIISNENENKKKEKAIAETAITEK